MGKTVFDKLSGLWIPSGVMRLHDLTATQKMIMGLAASFRSGLKLSNNQLSELLGIDRRNVIYNIQRLRKKGYLTDSGENKQHRILCVSSDKTPLLERQSSDKLSPVGSDKTPLVELSGSDVNGKKHPQLVMQLSPISNNINKKDIRRKSDDYRLSELLLNLIIERKPNFKKPNCGQWAKHIDRMLRLDRRTPAAIEEVIRWSQGDGGNGDGRWSGWQNNILSTMKLRQHFDKLELAMGKARAKMGERTEISEQKKTAGYLQTLEAHKKACQQHLREIENGTTT